MGVNPCCCVPLKTGAKIIAVLQILGVWYGIYGLIRDTRTIQQLVSLPKDQRELVFEELKQEYTHFDNLDEITSFMFKLMVYAVVTCLISLASGLLLLKGLSKEECDVIRISLILNVMLYIVSILVSIYIASHTRGATFQLTISFIIISHLLGLWFICVVYAAYLGIKNGPPTAFQNHTYSV